MDERKRIVQAGYDALGPRFTAWAANIVDDTRHRLLDDFASRLPDGARVLELGCGAGLPATRKLADRFEVVGVDISAAQLALARGNVPQATFVEADFLTLDLPPRSFDGVCAFYSITHVPRDAHAELFRRIATWLEPEGLFLASLSAGGSNDWTGEWLGVEMFFSGFDADTNRRLLWDAPFALVVDEIVTVEEPEGPATFLWVLAKTASSARPRRGAGEFRQGAPGAP
ncbi:MAG: class I SAM-dependent methyltransferase [Actinomycetota bacterium]|nr:class I SAM-dependent methyltransferase [Actinomycetota bacterium]